MKTLLFLILLISSFFWVSAQEEGVGMFGKHYIEVVDYMNSVKSKYTFDSKGTTLDGRSYLSYKIVDESYHSIVYYFDKKESTCDQFMTKRYISDLPGWLRLFNTTSIKTGEMEWVSSDGFNRYRIKTYEEFGLFTLECASLKQ